MLPKVIVRRSIAQEKKIAVQLGGRRVVGSGNSSALSAKGDVKTQRWLVEAKTTTKPRFSLTLVLWRKISSEAIRANKHPAMFIEMAGQTVVVISFNAFKSFAA